MIKKSNILKGLIIGLTIITGIYIYIIQFHSSIITCKPDIKTVNQGLAILMEDDEVKKYIPKTIDDYEIVSIDLSDEKINLVCHDGVDKKSFEIVSAMYSKDKNGIYFGRKMRFRETNNVIYEIHNTLEGIDPVTFEDKGQGIISDKNGLYFTYRSSGILQYQKIEELDRKTFSFVEKKRKYIQDKNGFYYFHISYGNLELIKIEGVNVSEFKNIGGDIYSDGKNIIYSGVVRKDIDLSTFGYSDLYQIDKNHVYHDLRIVEGLVSEKTVAIIVDDEDYLTDGEIVYRFPPIGGGPRKIEMNGHILRKYLEKYSEKSEFDISYFQ